MHYNLWRVFSGEPAASRLRHQRGLDTGKVREKTISLFALQLPLSASLASNSSEGLDALFSNCILSLSAAVFEGKEIPAAASTDEWDTWTRAKPAHLWNKISLPQPLSTLLAVFWF